MKKILFIVVFLSSCSTTNKVIEERKEVYVEDDINNCELLGKQPCPRVSFLGCYGWHERKAKDYDSNKIIIIGKVAEYWNCEFKRFEKK